MRWQIEPATSSLGCWRARFQPMRSWILGSQSGEVVHEYKDHNFVIDFAEAQAHLGVEWVKTWAHALQAGEDIYSLIEMVNFFLRFGQSKRLYVSGGAAPSDSIMVVETKR